MEKNDEIYLNHILDAINQIDEYTYEVDYEDFQKEKLRQDGVIRQLEIIGEASKNLSKETRKRNVNIPWIDIVGMRDKLIHHYFGVNVDAVWRTAKQDIPHLKNEIINLLGELNKNL